jgi:hypothetical protein
MMFSLRVVENGGARALHALHAMLEQSFEKPLIDDFND